MLAKLLTGGGLVSALVASTCCVVPLGLGAAGVGGAWLSTLSILEPYQTAARVAAILLLSAGFWMVYGQRAKAHGGAACGTARGEQATKVALWIGAGVLGLVLTSAWWQGLLA